MITGILPENQAAGEVVQAGLFCQFLASRQKQLAQSGGIAFMEFRG